jgi:hypothetical protein
MRAPTLPLTFRAFLLAAAAGLLLLAQAMAGTVNEQGGIAIKGYDPVAYFTDHQPVLGSPDFTAEYHGATFRFASAAHRDAFLADPDRYAPQYDGFCAYGAAEGHKADIDPAAFTVTEGKLFLNYNKDVRATWTKDIPGYVAKADRNWPTVSQSTEVIR